MQRSLVPVRLGMAVMLSLFGCSADQPAPTQLKPLSPLFNISDGYEQLSVTVAGPGRINPDPQPPRGTYDAMFSGGTTPDYYYVWSIRTCTNWDSCPNSGFWYEYSRGANRNPETIYVSSSVVLLEIKVEVGEWNGDPNFVGRTGISPGRLIFGPAGFGGGGGFNICGDNPTHYPFHRDTVVSSDTLTIGYTYKKCGGGRFFDPAGPQPQ
jgi:hypothetical protein